jgi:hypothetical protein
MMGLINLDTKCAGTRSAGNPHAACDVAGAGNVTTGAGLRAAAKAAESPPDPTVRAPALDPTKASGVIHHNTP